MRVLIFTLLILSQNLIINCSILNILSAKFNEFNDLVINTYNNAFKKIKGVFVKTVYVEKKEEAKKPEIEEENDSLFDPFTTYDMRSASNDVNDIQDFDGEVDEVSTNNRFNPTVHLATPQLARWHGRDMESHKVLTNDDYILTIHRIPTKSYLQANRTVLLHHGLFGSSTDWILLGPKNSLPYILSDAGFDVWITNARGNCFSHEHLTKEREHLDYWKFSWQEMGEFDLPAVIGYIRDIKDCTEPINFVGHSMGATALLVLLSSKPKYNQYLRLGILLAPLAYMNNVKGPIKAMRGMSEELVKIMGNGEFLPSRKVPTWLAAKYCKGPKIFCSNPLLFLTGVYREQRWHATFVAKLLYHVPAGGSTNTLLHYIQVADSGKFHRFNQPSAEFLLRNVTVPIALISSSDDCLATVPNVLKLYFGLSNPIEHYIIRDKNVLHTDFVWGADAKSLVFKKTIEILERKIVDVKNAKSTIGKLDDTTPARQRYWLRNRGSGKIVKYKAVSWPVQ